MQLLFAFLLKVLSSVQGVFVPFSCFIFFLNLETDKSQIIFKLFMLLPTPKSSLSKEIILKAVQSADKILSLENASAHACVTQIGGYRNYLAASDLAACSVCLLGFGSRSLEQSHEQHNLGCQVTQRVQCWGCSGPWQGSYPWDPGSSWQSSSAASLLGCWELSAAGAASAGH